MKTTTTPLFQWFLGITSGVSLLIISFMFTTVIGLKVDMAVVKNKIENIEKNNCLPEKKQAENKPKDDKIVFVKPDEIKLQQ